MSIISLIAVVLIVALIVWKIGAEVARIGGALIVLGSLLLIACGDSFLARIPLLLAGIAIWLIGHIAIAYKSDHWHSRLARGIVTLTPLKYIDPVDGSNHRQARRADRTAAPQDPDRAPEEEDVFDVWEREFTTPVRPTRRITAGGSTKSTRRSSSKGPGLVVKKASHLATRAIPGSRAIKSAWRLLR